MPSLDKEISDALRLSSLQRQDQRVVITPEFDCAVTVRLVSRVPRAVAKSREVLFWSEPGRRGIAPVAKASPLGRDVISALQSLRANAVTAVYHHHRFHPFFELFERVLQPCLVAPFESDTVHLFNACVDALRAEAASRKFHALKAHHERAARKTFVGFLRYMEGLHALKSKLLVVRLDLGYHMPLGKVGAKDPVSFDEAYKHREAFIDAARALYRDAFPGYAWKLEWTSVKSFHYHVMLFLDGHQHRQDVSIAWRLGELWRHQVTGGRGRYYNCNAKEKAGGYLWPGVGLVHYHDQARRFGMRVAANYMCKVDWYVKLELPGGFRTFGRGVLPRKPKRSGRPRRR